MKKNIDRREFLKLAGWLSLGLAIPPLALQPTSTSPELDKKNILIIVFDAFSANNIPLYGYARETTPNLTKLAKQAIVYHNHFAGSNFTTPGTASLFTGTLPWTHRALNHDSTVIGDFVDKNIFQALTGYDRIAYSHNPSVNTLISQFSKHIENFIPLERLFLASDGLINRLFKRDEDIATLSWARAIKRKDDGYAYSLFLSNLYEKYKDSQIKKYVAEFPHGLPHISVDNYYLLEDAVIWLKEHLPSVPKPFFGYFHLLPPHSPYYTRREFCGRFSKDGYRPLKKPEHLFSEHIPQYKLLDQRTKYDEYILYVDEQFGRLHKELEQSGLLENTWLILTSDHGEMFERGIAGHTTAVMSQPLVHIPLLIFEPGRKTRADVYTPTSAVDILPTLLKLTNKDIPEWCEGTVLPPFAPDKPDPSRNLFSVQARHNDPSSALRLASVMLVKGKYKLVYFFGYNELGKQGELVELYDVENDPEELKNLYPEQKALVAELLYETKAKIAEVNKPFS
jgi:arylsulfatase A-like enzyme